MVKAFPPAIFQNFETKIDRSAIAPRVKALRAVLDETGLVRGTTNVYAVGNGAIPSRNSVNPTLTTVALALHTADRIFDKGDAR